MLGITARPAGCGEPARPVRTGCRPSGSDWRPRRCRAGRPADEEPVVASRLSATSQRWDPERLTEDGRVVVAATPGSDAQACAQIVGKRARPCNRRGICAASGNRSSSMGETECCSSRGWVGDRVHGAADHSMLPDRSGAPATGRPARRSARPGAVDGVRSTSRSGRDFERCAREGSMAGTNPNRARDQGDGEDIREDREVWA